MKIMFDSKTVNRTQTFKLSRYQDEGSNRFVLAGQHYIDLAQGFKITIYYSHVDGWQGETEHIIQPVLYRVVNDETAAQEFFWDICLNEEGNLFPISHIYDGIDLYANMSGFNDVSLSFVDYETKNRVSVYAVELTGVVSSIVKGLSAGL